MNGPKRYSAEPRISERSVRLAAGVVDFTCVLLGAGVLAGSGGEATMGYVGAGLALASAVLAVVFLQFGGAYRLSAIADARGSLPRAGLAVLTAAFVPAGLTHLVGGSASSVSSLTWLSVGGILALPVISRALLGLKLRRWQRAGRLREHIAIVGSDVAARHLLWHLHQAANRSFDIVGIYGHRTEATRQLCLGHSTRGQLETLVMDARRWRIDTVMVALPATDSVALSDIVAKLSCLDGDVRLGLAVVDPRSGIGTAGGVVDLVIPEDPRRLAGGWRRLAKGVEDRVLAFAILVLIAPILAAIAIAIRIDSPGPVLFRQKRYGLNNRLIDVLKFRTMHQAQTDANGAQLTRVNDPRITRVGAFLRRNSLDELPQFINVLRGDMSIVGPRPHAISAKAGALLYHEVVKAYDARHRVKPGITGWAQINGWRGETNTSEQLRKRVEHDLYYIANWSVGLDLRIILRTAFGGFRSKNAF